MKNFLLCLSVLSLTACNQNSNTISSSSDTTLHYQYIENGCDTGYQTFKSEKDYCDGLKNRTLNHDCAYDLRSDQYGKSCADYGPFVETSSSTADDTPIAMQPLDPVPASLDNTPLTPNTPSETRDTSPSDQDNMAIFSAMALPPTHDIVCFHGTSANPTSDGTVYSHIDSTIETISLSPKENTYNLTFAREPSTQGGDNSDAVSLVMTSAPYTKIHFTNGSGIIVTEENDQAGGSSTRVLVRNYSPIATWNLDVGAGTETITCMMISKKNSTLVGTISGTALQSLISDELNNSKNP